MNSRVDITGLYLRSIQRCFDLEYYAFMHCARLQQEALQASNIFFLEFFLEVEIS